MNGVILTCNAGSSNTKLAAFDARTLARTRQATTFDTATTLAWLHGADNQEVVAIGHRVVHGGLDFTQPVIITPGVQEKLRSYIPLAPLHQPAALACIEAAQERYPAVPHIACFDTAFHHTMREDERRFALPRALHDQGILRYGFHGLSYQHVADVLPGVMGDAARGRIVVAHLGGGASACALHDLKSVASTMGFSTLDGLMMGTRCGAIDPGVLLYLLGEGRMSLPELTRILYHESGLRGVSGISGDMRALLADSSPAAQEAVALYGAMAAKAIAALLPALGGIDGLVFTGGIGEHAATVRERITQLLRWAGDFPVHVIPADEEMVLARACKNHLTTPKERPHHEQRCNNLSTG
ncbi:MAG: acetate kinase [Alphaproteobacteria bacterium]|nr:acetate kinase [Alphaproteobacteria bacterium]